MRPSLLDLLPAQGAAGQPVQAHSLNESSLAWQPGPAVPRAAGTHFGKDWHVCLDPSDPSSLLVAVLSVFEEFGRGPGSERSLSIPALGRTWSGERIDYQDVFASLEGYMQSVTGFHPGALKEGCRYVTPALPWEERQVVAGPIPVRDLSRCCPHSSSSQYGQ